jgi:hypothetical protein
MTDLTIPNTIKEQLGHKALYMLGAKNLAGAEDYLVFKISNCPKISHIRIKLNSLDLYDIEFLKVRGSSCSTVKTSPNTYAEDMHQTIEQATGLYLSL